ncbi:MAG: methyltransferase domain-containing protein [Chloroflexi bacterium]|nr:methyltransferase domain-containing protein [Chloroflexota bacterium]
MSAELEILAPETLVKVPCNLCGSWDAQELYPAAERRNGHGSSAELYACTNNAYGICGPIVKCRRCGLVYQSPVPSCEEILDAYDEVVDRRYEEERSGRIETFSRDLAMLHRHERTGRLLDVGCHLGLFLEVAREHAWDVSGVEPSRWSVERARERGLDVRHGTLETVHLPEASFDVVTMWDVIEHLSDPLAELRQMHRVLKPNGLLAISTMNVDALFPRLAGRRWPWYMQMHLVYFSRRSLHNMLAKAGYRVVEMAPHRRVVRLSYLVSRLESYCRPAYQALDWLVRKTGQADRLVAIDLGDIFVTFARKIG